MGDMINDYDGCLEVIKTLTNVIDGLYNLEVGTLSANPFNRSTTVDDAIKKLGIADSFFADTAETLTLFRSVLVGDNLNWGELLREAMR
jgi:ABC-type branched-subunit amino acid transport system ATPase component